MELRTPHLLDARALIHRKRRLTSAGRALRFGDTQRDDCFGPTDYGDLRTGIGHKHRSFGSVPRIVANRPDQERYQMRVRRSFNRQFPFRSCRSSSIAGIGARYAVFCRAAGLND
jgi:hypothetical protein